MPNHHEPFRTVHPLDTEINRLVEKQAKALKTATYIGLTPKEAKQCEDCHTEIVKLVKQLLQH